MRIEVAQMTGDRRRFLPVAYLIGAFGLSLSAQVNFLVPLRARELGAGFDVIGLIVGAGALSAAAMSVASGAAIDRMGPKRAFVVGSTATAVVSVVLMLVEDYWWFLALQPLHGVARNLGWVASQGYITAIASDAERPRFTGRFSLFSNVGQMAGPLLAGAAASLLGFRLAFVVPALYAATFALLGLMLRETRAPDHEISRERQGSGLRSALRLAAVRGVQVALLLTFARLWTAHIFGTFFPVYLVDRGIEPGVVGAIVGTSGFVAALMAPTTGFWTRFLSPQATATVALACGALGLVVAPLVPRVPLVFAVPVLAGVGSGLSLPLLMSIVTTAASPRQRGVALGLRGMVNQAAASAAPAVVGPLMATLGLGLGFAVGGSVAWLMLAAAGWRHWSGRHRPNAMRGEAAPPPG